MFLSPSLPLSFPPSLPPSLPSFLSPLPSSLAPHWTPLPFLSLQRAFTLSASVSTDSRMQAMNFIKQLPLDHLMLYVCPHLYALHDLSDKVHVRTYSWKHHCGPRKFVEVSLISEVDLYAKVYYWDPKNCPH